MKTMDILVVTLGLAGLAGCSSADSRESTDDANAQSALALDNDPSGSLSSGSVRPVDCSAISADDHRDQIKSSARELAAELAGPYDADTKVLGADTQIHAILGELASDAVEFCKRPGLTYAMGIPCDPDGCPGGSSPSYEYFYVVTLPIKLTSDDSQIAESWLAKVELSEADSARMHFFAELNADQIQGSFVDGRFEGAAFDITLEESYWSGMVVGTTAAKQGGGTKPPPGSEMAPPPKAKQDMVSPISAEGSVHLSSSEVASWTTFPGNVPVTGSGTISGAADVDSDNGTVDSKK